MAKFLTTHATASQLESVILQAKSKLYLVTPYLQVSPVLLQRLTDAGKRGVRITVVYGKDELRVREQNKLADLTKLRLYYLENLHAKCYMNEQEAIIGSMNMYEFSEKSNREMSVLLSRLDDPEAFCDAQAELKSILNAAVERKSPVKERRGAVTQKKGGPIETVREHAVNGFCIRCSTVVQLDADAPYCRPCYSSWAWWGNEDFEEKHCHGCGSSHLSTMAKPLCLSCFRSEIGIRPRRPVRM
jgi:phosphatidylserine/phosphatidylglycerophosphate/cardiolipin synthase-like enzyme